MVRIEVAESPSQIDACFPAYAILRPHLTYETFVSQVSRQQQTGYRILSLSDKGEVKGILGFRVLEYLAWGKILYIDDLSTMPEARGQGYASQLIDWVTNYAHHHGCNGIHLDTGYTRRAAHRVYLSKGFELNSHHMVKTLKNHSASYPSSRVHDRSEAVDQDNIVSVSHYVI